MRLMRVLAVVAIAAVALPAASSRVRAEDGGEVEIHRTSIDVNHGGGAEPDDQADISVVVKDVQNPATCSRSKDDLVKSGVKVSLHAGSCSSTPDASATLPSFRAISGSSLAVFEGETAEGETASAVLRHMPTPAGTCGKWKLKLDVSKADLSQITSNPVAVTVELPDGSAGCVEIDNAAIDR
jgi:hypothetical protein